MLEGGMGCKGCKDCIFSISLCLFPDLDDRMKVATTPRGENHVLHLCHSSHSAVDGGFVGCTHEHLVFVTARENSMIDKILFQMHPGKFNHGLFTYEVIGPRNIDKRTFHCRFVSNIAFKHDLCIRDQHPVRAPVNRHFSPEQFCSIGELFSLRHTGTTGNSDGRMDPNGNSNGQPVTPFHSRLMESIGMTPFDKPCCNPLLVQDLHPVNRGIFGSTISGKHNPRSDIFPRIPGKMFHNGDLLKVRCRHWEISFADHITLELRQRKPSHQISLRYIEGLGERVPGCCYVHHSTLSFKIMKEQQPVSPMCQPARVIIRSYRIFIINDAPALPHLVDKAPHSSPLFHINTSGFFTFSLAMLAY